MLPSLFAFAIRLDKALFSSDMILFLRPLFPVSLYLE
jgi:hypothetical protein